MTGTPGHALGARALGTATGLPIRFCAMERRLADAFGGPHGTAENVPIFAMERHIVAPIGHRPAWSRRRSGGV